MEYNQKALEAAIQTEKLGHPVYFFAETDTTNDRIRDLALEGAPEGTLAVAELQTAGRGRRGRPWQAPADTAQYPACPGIGADPFGGDRPDRSHGRTNGTGTRDQMAQ